jgi:hypothetical protein
MLNFIQNLKAIYYFGSMLIISIATACTVITMHIYKQGSYGKPVPAIIKRIFFDFISKIFFIKLEIKNKSKKQEHLEYMIAIKKSQSSHELIPNNKIILKNSNIKSLIESNGLLSKSFNKQITFDETNLEKGEVWDSLVKQGFLNEQKKISKLMKILNKHLDERAIKNDLDDYYEEVQSEWSQLSKIIDVLFAFIFICFAVVVMIFFIIFYNSH